MHYKYLTVQQDILIDDIDKYIFLSWPHLY